jgi:transposase
VNATAALPVVGVDLAKTVFQLAVADGSWRVVESHRLTRAQFEHWFVNRAVGLVVMEACGSAHHWARWFNTQGIEVRLLRAAYIRAYVRRNKTDAADPLAAVPTLFRRSMSLLVEEIRLLEVRIARHFASWFGLTPK